MNTVLLQAVAQHAAARLGLRTCDAERVLRDALSQLLRAEEPRVYPQPEERSAGYIKIPFNSKSEQSLPLRRALTYSADQMCMGQYQAAMVLTFFIRGVADEVSWGRVVRIPGLGMFGPWRWASPKKGLPDIATPRFIPARPFRNQVRHMCPPDRTQNEALETYRRSHNLASKPNRYAASTAGAMRAWQKHINKQAKYDVRAGDD